MKSGSIKSSAKRAAIGIGLIPVLFAMQGMANAGDFLKEPPRLILQITVDQLRGDLPTRYRERLTRGGFRYLWDKGLVYRNAHHPHANTETVVGHTTLATGAYPSVHGMVANIWYDRQGGHTTYNIEDADYRLLTEGADVDDQSEIDPTQRAARSEGRSPASILTTTFADELISYSNGKARAFAVSIKDRGAVSMAGHAGKAFWFSKATGEFVTSTYYYQNYPGWVTDWNQQGKAAQYAGTSWNLLHEQQSYMFSDSDDRPWEADLAGFGRTFPHDYGKADSKYFNTLLTLSPAGDALTLDFAQSLLVAEQLGQDAVTDYLSISFSSTDYVGHIFGPSSLEAEDNLLRLDQRLSDLLEFVDDQVGLEHTLVVLSADHGGSDTPGYLKGHNIPASYIDPEAWDSDAAIKRLKQRFGIQGEIIESYRHPYLYLDQSTLAGGKIDKALMEQAVVEEINQFPGVSLAISSSSLLNGEHPDTAVHRAVARNFHPKRSGDIFIVFEPNHFINDFDGLKVASTHGSPWRYDTHVPIVFAGTNVEPDQIFREVFTVDIAPTLALLMGAKPPSGSAGKVLGELFRN